MKFELGKYVFNKFSCNFKINVFEIGCGMAEHAIQKALSNPDYYFILSDPYLNSVAYILDKIIKFNLKNIAIWPSDFNEIIDKIPDQSLDYIHIFFPDPWPKKKHKKRRLIYNTNIINLINKLKDSGKLYFASDVKDYVDDSEELLSIYMKNISNKNYLPHLEYVKTKYHHKAEKNNKQCYHLQFEKIQSTNKFVNA